MDFPMHPPDSPRSSKLLPTRTVRIPPYGVIGGGALVVIAGPYAVEERAMILDTARAVRAAGASLLRGRAFQSVGEEGLKLLAEARAETGLGIVTEVADARHVAVRAEYADVLEIGSQNVDNFPLLAEVGRVGKPVLLTRGLATTVKELLMAVEHVMGNGNSDLILCERGVRTLEPSTRFTLDVATISVLRAETRLPVIVDPSHAARRAALVAPLAYAAIAAGADGLMVEVHPDPAAAITGGGQPLPTSAFAELMNGLPAFAIAAGRSVDAAGSGGGAMTYQRPRGRHAEWVSM
jgi:3-deoxy-7-phosphoheptulonate synthase